MKMMSFLAGLAAGFLLAQSRSMPAAVVTARQPSQRDDPAVGERDYSTLGPRTDEQLRERIVGQVGRTLHDPEAIHVQVSDGCVTLTGQVQARDAVLLMAEVEKTTGVTEVRNQLVMLGSIDDVVAPMTVDSAAVRDGEAKSSRMS